MSEQSWGCRPKDPFPTADIEGYDLLAQIALDMRSSWNHATDQLWQQLDPLLWELTHNPWVETVRIRRFFPDSLSIAITEREPVAVVNMGFIYYLDKKGNIFKVLNQGDRLDYPVITGFS